MTVTYTEAAATVTAPGQLFEVEPVTVRGIEYRAFTNAPANLRDLFGAARDYGDKTFLVYEDERWGFDLVMARVDALGALLAGRYGVGKGDRVAIGMRNYPEWVMSFAAITSIGAISVSLNAWWSEDELDYALKDSGAKVLIADQERVERTAASAQRLGIQVLGVRTDETSPNETSPNETSPNETSRVDRWEDVLPLGSAPPEVPIDPDDDATILYTSGTTGRPKGAVSTHRAIMQALMGFACRVTIEKEMEPDTPGDALGGPEQSFILIVPLFHVTGCVPVMLACFALGMKLVVMYRWDPERALQLIERERVTNFVGVPTQSWDLLESPHFSDYDTSSLLTVGGGGAPAPPSLVRKVAANLSHGKPNIGYGLTETNAYGPGNAGRDYVAHPTSTGRATPIVEVSVRDPLGQEVPTGASGEIWLKGPNLVRGYWQKPEATAESFVDGWFRTGDVGHLDEDGLLYVEDRLTDMILRGGENVYSAEVEAALYEHPGVYEAAVFGVPHPRLGEEVAAIVVPRPGVTLDPAELQGYVGGRLAPFKVPSQITITALPLPRNAAGKVLKRQLRGGV